MKRNSVDEYEVKVEVKEMDVGTWEELIKFFAEDFLKKRADLNEN